MIMFERNNRTRPFLIRYALYLNYLGSILRNTSKALQRLLKEVMLQQLILDRAIRSKTWTPKQKEEEDRITDAFIIDKTQIQIISNEAWLWGGGCGTNWSNDSRNLSFKTQRNMIVAETFQKTLIRLYGRHILYILRVDHDILKHAIL
jgi:hypothetical protein